MEGTPDVPKPVMPVEPPKPVALPPDLPQTQRTLIQAAKDAGASDSQAIGAGMDAAKASAGGIEANKQKP